jgi:multidrug efflux pump subunit AcrA (membrane-fusion protein)
MKAVLKSPRDGFVRRIEPVGSHVRSGQLILILDSSQEEKYQAAIDSAKEKLSSQLNTVSQEEIDKQVQFLTDAANH